MAFRFQSKLRRTRQGLEQVSQFLDLLRVKVAYETYPSQSIRISGKTCSERAKPCWAWDARLDYPFGTRVPVFVLWNSWVSNWTIKSSDFLRCSKATFIADALSTRRFASNTSACFAW